jgi:hemerythrin-like domain-containing protein
VLEAFEKHRQVKTLIREASNLTDGSEKFDAKLKVMKENVEHHVDEEENEMFPKAQRCFDRSQLEQLGRELDAAKQTYRQQQRSTSSGSAH